MKKSLILLTALVLFFSLNTKSFANSSSKNLDTVKQNTIIATTTGTGTGEISDLKSSYKTGDEVKIRARASTGSVFTGWGEGSCKAFGSFPVCTIFKSASSETVTANFDTVKQNATSTASAIATSTAIIITKSGTGTGKIFELKSGDLYRLKSSYKTGNKIKIKARASLGSVFVGWGEGSCKAFGSNPVCTIFKLPSNQTVGVIFKTIK